MANTYPDDVALLKQELAQFLLAEIASAQGATTFRREVSEQVAAVIDQILAERLKPTLENMERHAAEHAQLTSTMMQDALSQLKVAAPSGDSTAFEQKLSDIAARLDEVRQRVGRFEDSMKTARGPAATAQPLRAARRDETTLANERLAAMATTASPLPRWMAWLLVVLSVLTVVGLGNLYYEKLMIPSPVSAAPPGFVQPPADNAPAPATNSAVVAPPHPQSAVSVSPQNPVAIEPVTTKPATTAPETAAPAIVVPPAQPRPRIPADFAIERGWLAAQPYAVDARLARRVGSSEPIPTLKSIICGRSPNCASDALIIQATDPEQVIALQMLMSQIGDRFCTPRRSVTVNGKITAQGLADLATVARCAGGTASSCVESQNKVCPPDADALQSGSPAARNALLRWALWKTGST